MIRYALRCASAHDFESWFASAAAFDTLCEAGHVACPVCGSAEVRKALMAPGVSAAAPEPRQRLGPTTPAEHVLARMRAEIEKRSENVGRRFAAEARSIHLGEAPERAIHGQARPEEARSLIEDGIEVVPLPFPTPDKAN